MRILCYVGLAGLLGSACTGDVVALVGKTAIGRGEVEATAKILAVYRDPLLLSSREQRSAFKREVINTLIEQYLIHEAAGAAGIRIAAKELDEYIEAHKGRYSDDSFSEMISQRGIDEATWRTQRERRLLAERYVAEVIAPGLTIDDSTIARYYQAHRDEFRIAGAVRARHILVADRVSATTVRKRLLNGENFAQLAVEYSMAPEAEQGGDVGWIERGQYPEIFEETCFRLPLGAVSDVVESQYGFHLFKVLERRRERLPPLPQVKAEIAERLRHDAGTQALTEKMAALRRATTIVIHEDAVQRVVLPQTPEGTAQKEKGL